MLCSSDFHPAGSGHRYAAKDVEKGVVVEEQKAQASTKEDELDDNASTATPDSLAQSVRLSRRALI